MDILCLGGSLPKMCDTILKLVKREAEEMKEKQEKIEENKRTTSSPAHFFLDID
jgi:hypothetical protein